MITWLYPERCPVCLRPVMPKGADVHPECKKKPDLISEPVCFKCGVPLASEEEEYCAECAREPDRGWDRGRSLFLYHGVMGKTLRLVKKEGTTEFVRFFCKTNEREPIGFYTVGGSGMYCSGAVTSVQTATPRI